MIMVSLVIDSGAEMANSWYKSKNESDVALSVGFLISCSGGCIHATQLENAYR